MDIRGGVEKCTIFCSGMFVIILLFSHCIALNSTMKTRGPAKKKVAAKDAGKVTKIAKKLVLKVGEGNKNITKSTNKIVTTKKCALKCVAKSPCCVVVYTTGDYELFRTELMARKQRGTLPGSLVDEYKVFATKEEATSFMEGSNEDKKPEARIVTPSKKTAGYGDRNANLAIKALNKIPVSRLDSIKFPREASLSNTGGTSAGQYRSSGDLNYLASMKKNAGFGFVEIQIHIFKYPFEPKPKYQIVTFELYDLRQKRTYWTHHGDKWEQTFQNAKANGFDDIYDEVCYQFHTFVMRNVSTLTSGLQNEPWLHNGTPRRDGTTYNFEKQGLYALFPFEYSVQQIKDEIALFGRNARKPVAMEAYDICHLSQNHLLKESLKPGSGTYWSMMESAFASNFMVIEEKTLDNMFLDEEILKFMGILFNEHRHPKDYGDSNLVNFAYGRITAADEKN
jgi:hypothetical protein